MISFTSNIKNEIAFYTGTKNEEMATLSAIIRNNSKYDDKKIIVSTENSKVARRIYLLLSDIYNLNVSITDKDNAFNRNRLYLIQASGDIVFVLKDLQIVDDNFQYKKTISDYMIENDDDRRAYLRGIFLSCGSINDPKTSRYHLEFFINNVDEAYFVNSLLNMYYLNSKVILKDKKYMVYIKEAEKIGDFLRIVGANNAVMYYEDIRIYRDHKNMTNRLNNMEQANIEKTINTALEQINDINLIMKVYGEDLLDEKTKEVCKYRIKYPESSLQELSEIMSRELNRNITKSGINHRFRKIKELAKRVKESRE